MLLFYTHGLRGSSIKSDGARAIGEGLKYCVNLKYLKFISIIFLSL